MAWLKKLALLGILATPGVASAASMQYIVYNAFDETVQAFQRLALITGDSVFLMIAGCFVAGSIVMSATFFAAEGMAKKANNPFGFLIQAAAGLALFFGAVMPKGTIYVYDEVLNKNQAVGGIPDLVVFFAGGLNAVERELTRMVDTAAATPYSNDVGAIGYQLIYNASRAKQSDADLERTIGQYVLDCGLTAVGTNQNGATLNELLRTSTDLRDTLAKFTHPSWPTTYYPSNNSGGVPGTCADAWAYIRPLLDNVTTGPVGALKNQVCTESGFNMTDANAAAKCESAQVEAAGLFGVAPSSSGVFLRNFIVAKGMMNMLMRPDFTGAQGMLVNRNMMAEGLGATEALNEWVPRLRAMMLALVLGILPIPLLFLATNLVYKSLGLVIGLLAFMALWGVTDAISVQMARDAAATAFTSMQQQHVGFESLMLAPTASLQALALYGKYRMMAMGMATLIAGALFKVSTGAFGQGGEAAGKDLAVEGGNAGKSTMTSEGLQSTMGSLAQSGGATAQVATHGSSTALSAGAYPSLASGAAHAAYLNAATVGTGGRAPEGLDSLISAGGALEGGGRAGKASGLLEASRERGDSPIGTSVSSSSAETQLGVGGNIGGLQGAKDLAAHRGTTVQDVSSGVAGATRAFDGEQALSRREAGRELTGRRDGDLDVANISGASAAAVPFADEKTSKAFEGGDRVEQLGALAQARNASTTGLGEAAGGDVSRIEGLYKTEHTTGLAKAETIGSEAHAVGVGQGTDAKVSAAGTNRVAKDAGLAAMKAGDALSKATAAGAGGTAEHLGGATKVGHEVGDGQVRGNVVSSRATTATWNALGPAAMVQGATYGKAGEAYRGAAAAELGGGTVFPTAKETSDAAVANDVAGARISGAIGKQLGLNPDHIKDRLDVSERQRGVVSMTLSESDKRPFADAAVRSGAMTAEQAKELMAHEGPQRVDFAIDPSGNIGAAKVTGLSDVASGRTIHRAEGTTDTAGDTFKRGDTRIAGDDIRVAQPLSFGGTSMPEVQAAAQTVRDLMGANLNDGKLTPQVRDVLAQSYAQRFENQGRSLSADAAQTSNTVVQGGGELSARTGGSGPRAASAGGGINAGVQVQENWQHGHRSGANAFTTGMREAIDANWHDAKAATEKQFGDRATWNDDAHRYLTEQFAARNEGDFQRLSGVAVAQTGGEEASAQGHNTLRDKWEGAKGSAKEAAGWLSDFVP